MTSRSPEVSAVRVTLRKLGAGSLTLEGTQSYSGQTTVDDGDIIFRNDAAPATSGFSGAGTVTIEPMSDSFSAPVTLNATTSGITGLTIGKATNTADISINSNQAVDGNLTVYAGDISVNSNINTSNASGANVLLKASGDIELAASVGLTTDEGNVTLWSDSDNSGAGSIRFSGTNSVVTGGGNIVLGGGLDANGDGAPDGDAIGSAYLSASGDFHAGISLYQTTLDARNGGTLDATAGNITINGTSTYTGGDRAVGTLLYETKLIGDLIDVTGTVTHAGGTTTRYGISSNGNSAPNNTSIQAHGGIVLSGNAATPADQWSIRWGTNHEMSVSQGDIEINSDGQLQYLSSQTLTIPNTFSLIFNSNESATWSNVIAGAGGLIKQGTWFADH